MLDKRTKEVPREQTPKLKSVGEKAAWVGGLEETENDKYRKFLAYCEERRREWKMRVEEDENRKRMATRKEDQWLLLRETVKYLKENDKKWQDRKIAEVSRIREEEKLERLAIVREKKKRYGIKTLSKEESKRLKERSEERIIVSKAKANYWKRYRDIEDEEEREHWQALKRAVIALEERGGWTDAKDDLGGRDDDDQETLHHGDRQDDRDVRQDKVDLGGLLDQAQERLPVDQVHDVEGHDHGDHDGRVGEDDHSVGLHDHMGLLDHGKDGLRDHKGGGDSDHRHEDQSGEGHGDQDDGRVRSYDLGLGLQDQWRLIDYEKVG